MYVRWRVPDRKRCEKAAEHAMQYEVPIHKMDFKDYTLGISDDEKALQETAKQRKVNIRDAKVDEKIPTLEHLNTRTLEHSNTRTLEHSNT